MLSEDDCIDDLKNGWFGCFVEYDGGTLFNGQIVHVRITRGEQLEESCRRVRLNGRSVTGQLDKQPTAKKMSSIKLCGADTQVLGILVGVYRPYLH